MHDYIMVSIACITYNHEKYIADALEGFMMQKTDFKYEVLIHDDASTDSTADIIKSYEKNYPDIIRPIYQSENQKTKGVKVGTFNRQRATGKYIAICEGDDYWTDPDKLQRQVSYMENHPECSLCVHAAYKIKADNKKMMRHVRPHQGDKIFSVSDIIRGGGGFFATNTMLFRTEYEKTKPPYVTGGPVGDYPLAIYLATRGDVFYIDEFMSAYRVGVPGSWTSRMINDAEQARNYYNRLDNMLNDINQHTAYQYDADIRHVRFKNYLKRMFPRVTKALKILRNSIG